MSSSVARILSAARPTPACPTQRSSVANPWSLRETTATCLTSRAKRGPAFLSLPSSDFLSEGAGGGGAGGKGGKTVEPMAPSAIESPATDGGCERLFDDSSRLISWVIVASTAAAST